MAITVTVVAGCSEAFTQLLANLGCYGYYAPYSLCNLKAWDTDLKTWDTDSFT
jgi:hypothetical protein